MLRKVQVAIYYNNEKGYIFFPVSVIENGPRVIIDPAVNKSTEASADEITSTVLELLEISEKAAPAGKEALDNNLIERASGIKSTSRFHKTYNYLDCELKDGYLYFSDSEDIRIECIPCENKDEIGKVVLRMKDEDPTVEEGDICQSFTTVHESTVSYLAPSDDFIDIGDGHTDAYQIYTHIESENTYIGFFIDINYADTSEPSVRKLWKKMYDGLQDFQYKKTDKSSPKIVVSAKTDTSDIVSYLYEDGDGLMEVTTVIRKDDLTKDEQVQVSKAFEKIIDSIKITNKR